MSRLVAAARRYIGAPFRHRGRGPRHFDCAGLGWRAFADCGVVLPDFRLYGREPHNDGLVGHISAALGAPVAVAPVSAGDIKVGDVIVVRFEVEPHHVAIVTDYPYGRSFGIVHACGHTGRVIETRLAEDVIRRITHVFRREIP